jgi:aryl-alcohol dehydrogenase-like predicted oxidoreductase
MQTLPFGRTGHLSSRALLGAAAFSRTSQAESDAALELALAQGVNHVDVAASYGEAELRLGDWIGRHGRPFFLATKTEERTYAGARDEIRRSLEKLHVDQVDLIQLHNLVDPQQWQTAMGPGGALEAAIEARQQGLVRFIGVTGHGLTTAVRHREALERFDFDSVLLPYSYVMAQNAQYLTDYQALEKLCRERSVAIQTIKSIVHTPWGEQARTRATWYRPLEEQADIDLAVHWVLGHPGLFVNTVGDVNVLQRVLAAVNRFEQAPDEQQMQGLMERLEMASLFA